MGIEPSTFRSLHSEMEIIGDYESPVPGSSPGGEAMAQKQWIAGAIEHKGAFTAKAKKAGMSTSAYANKVTKKGSKASATTKRQANLAKTLRKFH